MKQNQEQHHPSLPRVTIPETEVRVLRSSATGRIYDIYVHLPSENAQQEARTYPTLYVLDGQWDFKLLDSIVGGLSFDQFVPEMLIVGLTYAGTSPDYNAMRAQDYTPVSIDRIPGSGGAPEFLKFFKEELIPFIEANYQSDQSRRILLGSSFGGSFTLYTLFENPGLFSGYIAASPAVPYADRAAFLQEVQYASCHKDLPVRLFISVGELERLAPHVQEYVQVISERRYLGLQMEWRIIAGERHVSNKPEAYNRALKFIFQDG